jgi:hypothetical protein
MADMQTSVEFIEYTLSSTLESVNLSKGQDYTNCVPFMTLYGGQNYQDCNCVDVYFSGTTESGVINFERSNSRGGNAYIKCYVVEFDPDEVKVHQGSLPANVSNTTSENEVTVSGGFVQTNSFMVFNWKSSSGGQNWDDHMVRSRVNDDDTVDFYRFGTAGTVTGHWFLVESINDQFKVEHNQTTYTSGASTTAFDFRYNFRQLFLGSFASSTSNYYSDRAICRLYPSTNGYFYSDRAYASYTMYVNMQVVTFLDNTKLFSFSDIPRSIDLSSTTNSVDFTAAGRVFHADSMNLSWDSDDMCAFTATPMGLSSIDSTSSAYINHCWAASWVSASGILNLQKANSSTTTSISTPNIVNWNGITVASGINNYPLDPEVTFVKSVESGSITIEDWTNAVPLTKDQDLSNCIILASRRGTGSAGTQFTYCAEVYIEEPGMVVARRGNASDQLKIEFSVIEFYPDQVKVQQGYLAAGGDTADTTISGVDISKSFLVSSWEYYTSNTDWNNALVKAFIFDSNTVRHARIGTDGTASYSWYLAEDIAGNNFDVEHFQNSYTSTSFAYSNTTNYPPYNTIVLGSYSGGSNNYYSDRSCARMYRQDAHIFYTEVDYDAYTKYYILQAIKIIRSNRLYLYNEHCYFGTSDTYLYKPLGQIALVNPDAVTIHNTNLASVGLVDGNSSAYIGLCFGSAKIDWTSEEVLAETGPVTGVYRKFVFQIINWEGYDSDTETTKTDTRSFIESIETFTVENTSNGIVNYLTKGQEPSQCVPFLTTYGNASDSYLERLLRTPYIYSGVNPYLFTNLTSSPQGISGQSVAVVEFGKQHFNVQQGSTYMTGSTKDITVNTVDLNKAFLIFYVNPIVWGNYDDCLVCGYWLDESTIRFTRYGSSGSVSISFYIVECKNNEWEVKHYHQDFNSAGTDAYFLYDRPKINNTFFVSSYSHTSSNRYADRASYRVLIRADNNIQLNRQYDAYSLRDWAVETVEINKEFRSFFEYSTVDTSSSSTIIDFTTFPPLDLSRTIINNIHPSCFHRTNGSSDQSDYGFLMYTLSGTSAIATRHTRATSYYTYGMPQVLEFPEYKAYYVEGNVVEQDLFPVERTVRMYRSDNGDIVDETVSASGTGYFRLETSYSGAHYVICLDDEGLPDYNDLIYGRIYPEVITGCFADNEGLI